VSSESFIVAMTSLWLHLLVASLSTALKRVVQVT
jgi:hypothetical protein